MHADAAEVDIRYTPRARDYFDAMASAARHSRFASAMGGYFLATAAITILLWGDRTSVVILLAGVLFLSGYLPAALGLIAFWRRRSLFTREVVIKADRNGVRWSRAGAKSDADWSTFRRVRDLPTAFILHIGTGGGTIVPKRAFDADSLERFRALARGAGVLDDSSPAMDLGIGAVIGAVVGGLSMLTLIAVSQS